jgi:hypothetical protein
MNRQEIPDCSNHKKDLFGETDMKIVAEAIGDLHYKTLERLIWHLGKKLYVDSQKDNEAGRKNLASCLHDAAGHLESASYWIGYARDISKPFMKKL